MSKKIVSVVVVNRFNGNEEQVKTVEVDGKKYVADEADATKPKLDDKKQPILFVEKKADELPPELKDLSKAELKDLAKVNPAVAKLLDDIKKREESDTAAEDKRKKDEEAAAAKAGDWQKLAESRNADLESTKSTLKQKEEMLGKYVEMTEKVLTGLLATIPKENQSLIPSEFSPRQKLEYIISNASRLGAKVNAGVDGKPDKNDVPPPADEEGKMIARQTELMALGGKRTSVQTQEMTEIGTKLTKLRREKAGK